MIHHLAEINPSIVFFILWGILSWLSKNREKKAKIENIETNFSNVDSNINLDKQDDFEYEQDLFENNDEYKIEIVLFNFNATSTDELFKTNLDEPDVDETIEFYDTELINTASKYSKFENISSYISSIIEYQYNKEKNFKSQDNK